MVQCLRLSGRYFESLMNSFRESNLDSDFAQKSLQCDRLRRTQPIGLTHRGSIQVDVSVCDSHCDFTGFVLEFEIF